MLGLENAPYSVQAVFWITTMSIGGAGIGIAGEKIKRLRQRRVRVTRRPPKRARKRVEVS